MEKKTPQPRNRITLQDIADQAGVSRVTVSFSPARAPQHFGAGEKGDSGPGQSFKLLAQSLWAGSSRLRVGTTPASTRIRIVRDAL